MHLHLKRRHAQEGAKGNLFALLTSHPASSELLKTVLPSLLSPKKQDSISPHFPNHVVNSYIQVIGEFLHHPQRCSLLHVLLKMYNIALSLSVWFPREPRVLSEKHMIITAHWCHVAMLVYFWVWEVQQDSA